MPNRKYVFSELLFQSTAPFSHVVIAGSVGHVSGIIGQRRDNGNLVGEGTVEQAGLMFENLELALTEAKLGLSCVVATRLYLVSYDDLNTLNVLYREKFSAPFPARTTLQVAGLPLGARVQIDATLDLSGS